GTKAENEAETPNVYSFTTTAPGQSKRNQTPQVAEAGTVAGNLENGKVQITNGPIIEAAFGNSARIAWSTNIPGSTRVNYGTDINNMNQLAEAPLGPGRAHASSGAEKPEAQHHLFLPGGNRARSEE